MADGFHWKVQRWINGRQVYGGMFKVEEDAARASDALVLEYLESGGKFKNEIKLNM